MKYRLVSDHAETLDEGQSVPSGGFIELSDEQASMDWASELVDDGKLIPVDEGEGPTDPAKELAKANKIDLSKVSGTGAGGRITKEDVQRTIDENKEGGK